MKYSDYQRLDTGLMWLINGQSQTKADRLPNFRPLFYDLLSAIVEAHRLSDKDAEGWGPLFWSENHKGVEVPEAVQKKYDKLVQLFADYTKTNPLFRENAYYRMLGIDKLTNFENEPAQAT